MAAIKHTVKLRKKKILENSISAIERKRFLERDKKTKPDIPLVLFP